MVQRVVVAWGIGLVLVAWMAGAQAAPSAELPALVRTLKALPPADGQARHAVSLDAGVARTALKRGEARIDLPGEAPIHATRLRERRLSDQAWSLVGEVQTPFGPQRAVFTYGKDASYALIPTAGGETLRVVMEGGRAVLEPDGDLFPHVDGQPAPADADIARPARPAPAKGPAKAAAGRPSLLLDDHSAKALADTGPVVIDLLGLYTDELVARLGSVAAAETEFLHLLAVANEAYDLSGTGVQFALAGLVKVDYPLARENGRVLSDMQQNLMPDGFDLHAARDAAQADLVAMLRSYPQGASCGVGYIAGYDFTPEFDDSDYGFSVNNSGRCSQYVLAHELGHNLGSAHDRLASGDYGGAYPFSYGYRQAHAPAFGTVMAYEQGVEVELGRFSSPDPDCLGAPCGVADAADNVRSLRLMAPRIALYRQPPGLVELMDAVAAEPSDGWAHWSAGPLWFKVRLSSPAPAGGVTVTYETSDQTALAGLDYVATSGSLTIPEGGREGWIQVEVLDTDALEQDERMTLRLTSVTGGAAARTEASGRIIAPLVTLLDAVVQEGDSGDETWAQVEFKPLVNGVFPDMVYGVSFVDGTAVAGVDYVAQAAPPLYPGDPILVRILGNEQAQGDRRFEVVLTGYSGPTLVRERATVTIVDDDTVRLGFATARFWVVEGDAGSAVAMVPIDLSRPAPGPVVFDVASTDGSAAAPGDYAPVSLQAVTIPAGETRAWIPVQVNGDADAEADEYLELQVSNVQGAAAGSLSIRVHLQNDDGAYAPPTFTIGDAQSPEGNPGDPAPARLVFPITLDRPAITTLEFSFLVAGGTAVPGEDVYWGLTPARGWIQAGETQGSVIVSIIGDTTFEPDETIALELGSVSPGVQYLTGRTRAVGTLVDDDAPADFAARDDRIVLKENSPAVDVAVVANDPVDAESLPSGQLTLVSPPTRGTASVQDQGTASPLDDRIRYVPAPDTSGEDVLTYALCRSDGTCREARLQVVLRPVLDVEHLAPAQSGALDVALSGLRALPAARFEASALVAPVPVSATVPADATTLSPWDESGAGTQFVLRTLAAAGPGQPQSWRVLAEAASTSGLVDLYLGIDANGNGRPDPGERACSATMGVGGRRCELAVEVTDTPVDYWLLFHNRHGAAQSVDGVVFEVPTRGARSGLVATGPGRLAAGEASALRIGWNDPGLLPGERRAGYVQVLSGGAVVGDFPVHLTRTGWTDAPIALTSGRTQSLRLGAGAAHERMFIDVPAGATRLQVQVQGTTGVDVYLSRVAAPTGPGIQAAPARGSAVASGIAAGGIATVDLSGAALQPGRWYVTPVNPGVLPTEAWVTATVTATAPVVRPGSYFNAARSGHGLFVYPAGSARVGLWYTYLEDGTPTWYYLQGAAPGADGLWTAMLYRSSWLGAGNALVPIGEARMAPTGPDAFTFTYTLDGQTGSEPMAALGRGCPAMGGLPVDVSAHWFNPARAGAGYSVQMLPAYEFLAAFVYDGQGMPRFLLAERSGFGGQESSFPLVQLQGFCPLCERGGAPTRTNVGVLTRRLGLGTFERMQLDAIFSGAVPGAWTADEAIQPLGGAASLQGCQP